MMRFPTGVEKAAEDRRTPHIVADRAWNKSFAISVRDIQEIFHLYLFFE